MSTTEEIKVLFEALPSFSQQVLLDDLLQDFEVQGKVLDLAYHEVGSEREKKPCPYCKSEKVLKNQGYTDHGLLHGQSVANRARTIAKEIGLTKEDQEMADISGFCAGSP